MRALWVAAFVAVLLSAIAVRAHIQFANVIPPAMDPAYYPVQAWWLFNEGRLLYQDAPLIFVIDGIAAKALILAGMQGDRAYLVAAQAVDCITEPWVALFVFLFGFAWCGGAKRGIPMAMAGALLAVLSAPVIRMVSDFEKNSLGLVWAVMAWWSLWRALHAGKSPESAARSVRWHVATALALVLAALTHGGSFGCAALGAAAIMAVCLASGGISRRALIIGVVSAVIVGSLSLALLSAASPARAQTLFEAPQKIFGQGERRDMPMHRPRGPDDDFARQGNIRPPPMPGGGDPRGDIALRDDRGPQGDGKSRMGPPMGPPGGRDSHGTFIGLGVGLCGILVVALRWRREAGADRAVIIGLSLLCMLLVCPFLNPEYAQRLGLMAPVPVAVVFTFLGARLVMAKKTSPLEAPAPLLPPGKALYRAFAAWWIAVSVAYGAVHSITGISTPGAVLTDEELRELFALRSEIPEPRTTLIVAAHGIEWWAGYALHTPVRIDRVPDDAASKYARVLILKKTMNQGRRPPMPDGGAARNPDGPGGRPAPPGEQVFIPDNARSIHRGERFELFEVPLDR
ncbi:MAG: hypothetical protein K8R92_12195 [Planctomycetes bacterium]|nr:hypothetical protein [Planctomycetota bacterium]